MDGFYYFCIFILLFAAAMLIIAGISALCPPVAEIITARAVRFFDKVHPKECARVIAKLTASIALGLAIGGIAGLAIGEKGFFILPVALILCGVSGWRLVKKDYEAMKYRKEDEEEKEENVKNRVL